MCFQKQIIKIHVAKSRAHKVTDDCILNVQYNPEVIFLVIHTVFLIKIEKGEKEGKENTRVVRPIVTEGTAVLTSAFMNECLPMFSVV